MTDYISREAFAAEMKERQTEAWKWLREAKDHDTAVRADAVLSFLCEVKLTLDKIPAADVRENKRGKWEEKEVFEAMGHVDELQSAFCPVCKRYHTTPYSYYFTHYNFCPNCGADMREEQT